MPLLDDAKKSIGELLIVGFSGLELSDEMAAFYSQAGIGGAILFAPNYESPGQLAELVNQIQECRGKGLPLWISCDQEGGRVQRFKKPFTRIPEAAAVGRMDSPKLVFDLAEMIGRELKAVGINLNFAPVADIMTNPKNPVIGTRAYGTEEEHVSKIVSAVVRGHLVSKVQPCVKHFPGHGDTSTDSHFALPKVDTPIEVLREREFRPFVKAFKARCSFVMTAHILMPKIDPEFPATLSKKILQDILRKELRFSKVIVSDDMEMKAITDRYGIEDAPVLAVNAGCDLLCYRSEASGRAAYESLIRALDSGRLSPETVMAAVERSRALKREFLQPYEPVQVAELAEKIGIPAHQELAAKFEAPA